MALQQIVDGFGSSTRILVASIRSVDALSSLAQQGIDTFTFSPEIARALFDEPLTIAAASDFEAAAQRTSKGEQQSTAVQSFLSSVPDDDEEVFDPFAYVVDKNAASGDEAA